MKRVLLLALIALSCAQPKEPKQSRESVQAYSVPVLGDAPDLSRYFPIIDSLYKDYAKKNNFPSIAYGLVIDNTLVHSGATGIANVKDNRAATTKTMYRIASMSKSFTAMSILKLRDEGKLSLTDPVTRYIPEFAGAGSVTTDSPDITIFNLLTMSGGFPEDNPWGDRQLADSDQDLLDLVKDGISFSNAPGLEYEYSNLGFALLGKIITNVSGMPYEKYITDNIIKPIGMNDAKWEYTEIPAEALAPGYRFDGKDWTEEPLLHHGSYGAMGGLICSIEDFSKYVSLHLSAWPPRNDADNGPVRRSSIREMHQPWRFTGLFPNAKKLNGDVCAVTAGYGFGLASRQNCEGTVRVSHSGGLPGYGSHWSIYPQYNMGVVSFSNHTYGAPGMPNNVVLDTLIQLAGLKKRELPPSKILLQRKEEIMSILPDFKDAEAKNMFAENFWLDHSLESRRSDAEALFKLAGNIKHVSEVKPENQLRGSFVIECEQRNVHVFFTLTPERAAYIQQLDIELE
jgi:CubicO group peptidase (beta-lactamase class C family)